MFPAEGWACESLRACSGLVGAETGHGDQGHGVRVLPTRGLAAVSRRPCQRQISFGDALGFGDLGGSPNSLCQEPSGPWGKLEAKWPTGLAH